VGDWRRGLANRRVPARGAGARRRAARRAPGLPASLRARHRARRFAATARLPSADWGSPGATAQLYYNFYLRTSGFSYLTEAYQFYDAIHSRKCASAAPARPAGRPARRRPCPGAAQGAGGSGRRRARRYFPQQFDPSEEHLLLKEMRFRVRHIVVCLLLQRRDEARELLGVLSELVGIYAANLQARPRAGHAPPGVARARQRRPEAASASHRHQRHCCRHPPVWHAASDSWHARHTARCGHAAAAGVRRRLTLHWCPAGARCAWRPS